MSYEYEDDDSGPDSVLWGRVATFGIVAVLLFVLGRCSAPNGVDPAELAAAEQQVQDLAETNANLEAQLDAVQASAGTPTGGEPPPSEGTADPSEGTDGTEEGGDEGSEGADDGPGEGEIYVVESGDNLGSIAEDVYGDRSKFPIIAEANGIDDDAVLRVGQELVIPPDPGD